MIIRVASAEVSRGIRLASASPPRMVSLGRDGAGELYMLSQDKVWKIVRR
jgi:hypothetical protein